MIFTEPLKTATEKIELDMSAVDGALHWDVITGADAGVVSEQDWGSLSCLYSMDDSSRFRLSDGSLQ